LIEKFAPNSKIHTLLEALKSMIEVVTLQVFWSICLFFLVLLIYNGTCDVSANFTKLENPSGYLAPDL